MYTHLLRRYRDTEMHIPSLHGMHGCCGVDPAISILDTTYVLTYGVHRSIHTLCMSSAAACVQYYRCTLRGVHHYIRYRCAYHSCRHTWWPGSCGWWMSPVEHTRVVVVYMYTVPSLVVHRVCRAQVYAYTHTLYPTVPSTGMLHPTSMHLCMWG